MGKKISEAGKLTEARGADVVPVAREGSNAASALTLEKIKAYATADVAQQITQLQTGVAGKADKTQVTQLSSKVSDLERSQSATDTTTNSLQKQIDEITPAVVEGDVTNNPDNEDLVAQNGVLKLKNRTTASCEKGYVILRQGSLATQMTATNTIYEVRYSHNLNGGSITIPSGCVLRFCGGKMSNGTLAGSDTFIDAIPVCIFYGITLSGTFKNEFGYSEWFDNGEDDKAASINSAISGFRKVKLLCKSYHTYSAINPTVGSCIVCDSKELQTRTSYISTYDERTIIDAHSYPVVSIANDGFEMNGGMIFCSEVMGSDDVAIDVNPSSSSLEAFRLTSVHIQSGVNSIDQCLGTAIKSSKSAYSVVIDGCSIMGFEAGINAVNFYSPKIDCSFNFCKKSIVFNNCRGISLFAKNQAQLTESNLDNAIMDFVDCSGIIDGTISDVALSGYQSNPLRVHRTNSAAGLILKIGATLNNWLSNNYQNFSAIEFDVAELSSPIHNSLYSPLYKGAGVINPYFNLFSMYKRNDGYIVTFGPTSSDADTYYPSRADNMFFSSGKDGDLKYEFHLRSDNAYCNIAFDNITLREGSQTKSSTSVPIYCIGVRFNYDNRTEVTSLPKLVIIDYTDNNKKKRVFVFNRNFAISAMKTLYSDYIASDRTMLYVRSNDSNEFVTPQMSYSESQFGHYIKDINIRIIGKTEKTTYSISDIFAITDKNYSNPNLAGVNTFRSKNYFVGGIEVDGIVVKQSNGNPVEGQLSYDNTTHKMKFYNGTEWVFFGTESND